MSDKERAQRLARQARELGIEVTPDQAREMAKRGVDRVRAAYVALGQGWATSASDAAIDACFEMHVEATRWKSVANGKEIFREMPVAVIAKVVIEELEREINLRKGDS